jgi:AraC family transcriptional regulator of adaptative response / DNA-3-methyladenine glycosylase II
LAVRAILGQQISVKAASTLTGRLVAALSTPLPGAQQEDGIELSHLFPSPETLAAAKLTSLGMTAGRAAAIRSLCQAIIEGRIRFDGSAPAAEVVAQLEALPGIGCWTAQYIAMRALRDPDAFPASDLALRRALSRDSEPLSPGALARRSEAWRPWRAYAAIHLWMGRT